MCDQTSQRDLVRPAVPFFSCFVPSGTSWLHIMRRIFPIAARSAATWTGRLATFLFFSSSYFFRWTFSAPPPSAFCPIPLHNQGDDGPSRKLASFFSSSVAPHVMFRRAVTGQSLEGQISNYPFFLSFSIFLYFLPRTCFCLLYGVDGLLDSPPQGPRFR